MPRRPTKDILHPDSSLHAVLQPGLGALKNRDRVFIAPDIRTAFGDSLDLDAAMQAAYSAVNRWDYLLGHSGTLTVVGLEPHSAHMKAVSAVIRKRRGALQQLRPHLRHGANISEWFWVASGTVDLVPYEKAIRRLDQNGIKFVGKKLLKKHLESL